MPGEVLANRECTKSTLSLLAVQNPLVPARLLLVLLPRPTKVPESGLRVRHCHPEAVVNDLDGVDGPECVPVDPDGHVRRVSVNAVPNELSDPQDRLLRFRDAINVVLGDLYRECFHLRAFPIVQPNGSTLVAIR